MQDYCNKWERDSGSTLKTVKTGGDRWPVKKVRRSIEEQLLREERHSEWGVFLLK
jgi:hypothetical protein